MPPHPRRPTLPPSAVASVDSPAAAVAAAASASKLRMGALPFTVRLQHPKALDPDARSSSSTSEAAPCSGGSTCSTATPAGLRSSMTSAAAAAAAAAADNAASILTAEPAVVPVSNHTGGSDPGSEANPESQGSAGSSSSSGSRQRSRSWMTRVRPQRVQRAKHLPPPDPPQWLPLVMVSSLPHVELELVTADGRRHSGLFMMDSGERWGHPVLPACAPAQ